MAIVKDALRQSPDFPYFVRIKELTKRSKLHILIKERISKNDDRKSRKQGIFPEKEYRWL